MTELSQVRIDVHKLRVGMYVSALDRPWTETPFPLQGFLVKTPEQMIAVKRFCQTVFIDIKRSQIDEGSELLRQAAVAVSRAPETTARQSLREDARPSPQQLEIDHARYPRTPLTYHEVKRAEEAYRQVENALTDVYSRLRDGVPVDPEKIRTAADCMVGSIISCPNSFQWLIKIRRHESLLFDHAVRSATWGLICGRHIGIDELNLKALALGILLKDIGRIELQKLRERDAEAAANTNFIELGVKYLRQNSVSAKVLSVIKYHCERYDGSGKPSGLAESRIPLLARLAGIATFYDRTVFGVKRTDKPVAPSVAAKLLYEQRNKAFQEELVIEFIEAIGLYPMGTLVELNTGEKAIVAEQDPSRRLKPKVMVVTAANGKPVDEMRYVDLQRSSRDRTDTLQGNAMAVLDEHATKIVADLPPEQDVYDFKRIREAFIAATTGMLEESAGESSGRGLLRRFLPSFMSES